MFALRMEVTLELRFEFIRHCDVLFLTSQLCHLFFRCSYAFYDVIITIYFGTLEFCMEIMLQLRFLFVHHCDFMFLTSQLRYLFVRCSYVF